MEEVKLLGTWPSLYYYRIIWALKLKGIEYEYVEQDLSNKSDLLLACNPVHRKIPVLIHSGKAIAESTVILEYIEEAWPHNPLLSSDPYERAMSRFWTKFSEEKVPAFYAFFGAVGEEQENGRKEAKEVLKAIEEHALGNKMFFGGDRIGMTDLVLGWLSCWLKSMEEIVGVKLLEPNRFPHLEAWIKNFKQVPEIKENLPDADTLLAYFRGLRERFVAQASK